MQFNIYSQLQKELKEFQDSKVQIAGEKNEGGAKYLNDKGSGYSFNQKDTLDLIDLYYNSKFESGETDSEGQRKVFLNICQFRADVASKQVDIDVKDFLFVPDDNASEFGALFLTRKFKQWAKKNFFGELINETVTDFPKYGTVVVKKLKDKIERVPLRNIVIKQDAKSIKSAEYFIELHEDMTLEEMEAMKGWDTSELELNYDSRVTVYERYGRLPVSFYKKLKGLEVEDGDDNKVTNCIAFLTLDAKKKKETGNVLFIEEMAGEDRPYEEAHWKRQDGRWLGIGEVENQFENQVMRNMTANLRKRAMYWSSKHVFQSSDTELAKNLVRNVKDGEVLKIMPNGNITPVAIETRNLAEFQSNEEIWEKNSDQKSFTYEVATGEALPSGTPFRLGVVMSNAVNSHFALKRENLGLFFNRVVMDQVLDIFKKENKKAHKMLIPTDEKGIETLKNEVKAITLWQNFRDQLLSGIVPDIEAIKAKVDEEVAKRKNLEFEIPDGYYDELATTVTLVTTGENINLEKKIESLTNLYNTMVQKGDSRADTILKRILALTGEDVDSFGSVTPQAPNMPQTAPQGADMNQLAQMAMPQQQNV